MRRLENTGTMKEIEAKNETAQKISPTAPVQRLVATLVVEAQLEPEVSYREQTAYLIFSV
jgi:hypothetical protein